MNNQIEKEQQKSKESEQNSRNKIAALQVKES